MADEIHRNVKVARGVPPNYAAIITAFPAANKPGTIFTYHDTIYVRDAAPGPVEISEALMEHEIVHVRQQATYPGGAFAWWKQYLDDPAFRQEQELEAHVVEYSWWCKNKVNRRQRLRARAEIASRLSGPLYNKCMEKWRVFKYLRAVEQKGV